MMAALWALRETYEMSSSTHNHQVDRSSREVHKTNSSQIFLAMGRKKRGDLEEEGPKNATASPGPASNVGRAAKQPRIVAPQRKKRLSDESEPKTNPRNSKRPVKTGRPASKTKKSKVTESMEVVKEVAEEEVELKEDVDEVSPEIQKEELAREKLFAEIQEEYYDIVEELPLELDRNFTLIREMDVNVEECSEEIHEDLYEYLQVAQTINHLSKPENNEVEGPSVPGTAPSHLTEESTQLPAEFVYSLWSELANKISKVQKLSRDKLDLAEKVYEGLDRHLRRIDAELDKYPDLEDQDQTGEKSDQGDQSINPTDLPTLSQNEQPALGPEPSPIVNEAEASVGQVKAPSKPNKRKKSNKLIKNLRSLSTKSPRLSFLVSKPQDIQTTDLPDTSTSMNGYSIGAPEASSSDLVPDGVRKSDRHSPRLQTLSNLSPRKPSIIKLTGIFADPQPSAGPYRPETLSMSPSMTNTRVPSPSRQTQGSPTLFVPQIHPEQTTVDMRRSSPVLRERRSVSASIEKRTRTPSISNRKKVQEDSQNSNVMLDGELSSLAEEEKPYCYCNKVSYGIMIACDNEKCDGGEWVS
ncbi:uncharacterized protein MELLADRAFT_68053 [Melampsora larici-populina 98AG31]|uniref:Inhibitor of growth protein N-terminal histone-binding domain-containing protein n=1 Tax=Melampsora larici-populina (strain 98AG31 / pathotype 3-4-7) TaxID=747676 RepID=F4S5E4_MELLP|nr:uncharacterized protein MELLADRAFT_68053 [Melampsora larici-populina 98AG31]EGG00176.1 hypothetical protein MELLADRAFT_68053 [Melampsora larici-populina 98AG31]